MNIRSRLPDVGTTIFTTMSKLAAEAGAINLSQGFPDFDMDPALVELVRKHMAEGRNQYAPMPGAPALKQEVAKVLNSAYNTNLDPDTEILVTAGATQAIFSAIAALIHPGDEVIIFDPSYDCYNPAVRLNGGVPVHLNLSFPSFTIDWDIVRSRITPRTRMIIINSPHNPLGKVLTHEDLRELEAIILSFGLYVVSDEVYEKLIFDGRSHQSVLRYPALARHSIACFSFGKTFHATGWKVGYLAGPANLVSEVRKVHQYLVFSVNHPVQLALAEYLSNPAHYESLSGFYEQKRNFFLSRITGSAFVPLQTEGSYFQLLSYAALSSVPDTEMAVDLTVKHKVASIPVSVFYADRSDHRLLRFCFAKKQDTLEKAAEILCAL